MNQNANILNEINKINTKIESLHDLLSGIEKNRKTFTNFFPNQAFGINEKVLIENEIKKLQEEKHTLSTTMEKGIMLETDVVNQAIKDAWGQTEIAITEYNLIDNQEDFEHAQNILQRAGIIVDINEIKIIEYYVNTHSRSDLYLVKVFLAPGYGYATFDTGRAGWDTDILPNKKLFFKISSELKQF